MENHFEVTFPLVLESNSTFKIIFTSQKKSGLEFKKGMYYLAGDNGSGKTTFINMLALIAGCIGGKADTNNGTIRFNGEAYNGINFNHIRAAEIREKSFCIFPQRVFFLPISTRDNYIVLNGSEKNKAESFSSQEYPDLLSGGQQQKILMDIILDKNKAVWFLDEPVTNLDAERRHYFWKTLEKAYEKKLCTIFFIDHQMGMEIKNDKNFRHFNTLSVHMENQQKNKPPEIALRPIEIYENHSPQEFFAQQARKIKTENER